MNLNAGDSRAWAQPQVGCAHALSFAGIDPIRNNLTVRRQTASSTRPESRPILRLFQAIDVCYARIYHRLEVRSRCVLPREGAGLLVSNHTSGLDPLLIQAVCPRLIVWMVAKEYCRLPVLKQIFGLIEAIPVDRRAHDVAATRGAASAGVGADPGVFPEGRIETSRQLLPFLPGVGLMAIKTGLPVYPVFVDGTQRGSADDMLRPFLVPQQATVAFGRPLDFEQSRSKLELNSSVERIRNAVQALRPDSKETGSTGCP